MDRVYVVDTTLRDGEQSPEIFFTPEEKVRFGQQLARLGVDVIDAGYPGLGRDDAHAVARVAQEVRGPVIMALARPDEGEIGAALEALKGAEKARIHLYMPVSQIQLRHMLNITPEEAMERSMKALDLLSGQDVEVEFTLEDAFRADRGFLLEMAKAVAARGVRFINLSDTVGGALPSQISRVVSWLKGELGEKGPLLSIHCHDDLGMATANSVAALEAGARQFHATIGGVGTRAGNAALEEVVMALKLWEEELGLVTEVETKEFYRTVRILTALTGVMIQPHKAIIGKAAFVHKVESHLMAVVKEKSTFEIVRPEDVGYPRSPTILSKYSGRMSFEDKLRELGYSLDEERLDMAYQRFRELVEKKREIYDEDVVAIVEDVLSRRPGVFVLQDFSISSGMGQEPTARVVLLQEGEVKEAVSRGTGPIDAAFKAIDQITGFTGRLLSYSIRALTEGKDALGEVVLRVRLKGEEVVGRGVATDVVEASIKAYLDAVNKVLSEES